MKLKGDVKFKGKQIRDVENYVRNWVNFHGNSQKSENFHFPGFVLSKACKDQMRNYKRVMYHDTEK